MSANNAAGLGGNVSKPLVTVIVPIYNHGRFVEHALSSVIGQTYRNIEIIAIDDGSSDDSAERAAALLGRRMPDAKFIRRGNRGAHNTINEGMSLASGKYLTILNSDDFYAPERIERCVDVAERAKKSFIFTNVVFVDDQGSQAHEDEYIHTIRQAEDGSKSLPTIGFALMKNQIAISTGNFFFTKEIFESIGGFRHYRYIHDWDFILRALVQVEPYFLRENLYFYRLHGTNSFKSLRDLEEYETSEVMRNFLWSVTSRPPMNARAPSPYYWPVLFEDYIHKWKYYVYMPQSWQYVR